MTDATTVAKPKTKLVYWVENSYGETIVTMQRGQEEKHLIISETGLSGVAYESAIDYYLHDKHWTQEQFDRYWEDGGEDKEIDNYIAETVDYYDSDSTWQELI